MADTIELLDVTMSARAVAVHTRRTSVYESERRAQVSVTSRGEVMVEVGMVDTSTPDGRMGMGSGWIALPPAAALALAERLSAAVAEAGSISEG